MQTRRVLLRVCSAVVTLALAGADLLGAGAPAARDAIKLLTIGNSFAYNATSKLPALAKAGGKSVQVFHANLSGASLERHVQHLRAFEANPADPKGREFTKRPDPKTGQSRDFSLREALEADAWDVVTIQQSSGNSYKPESYEPFAAELIAYIKKYAPQAEIVVIETWSYRHDHPTLVGAGMTPAQMHAGLSSAYRELAARHGGLRIAPVGDAFHLAQRTPLWTLRTPDPDFDYKNPPAGRVPNEPGNLYKGWGWEKVNGQPALKLDAFHANDAGCYLGGAVLYETLFGADATKLAHTDSRLTAEQSASLRQIAHLAVAEERARAAR